MIRGPLTRSNDIFRKESAFMKTKKFLATGIAMMMLISGCSVNVWAEEESPKAHIAFTIDDGYADLPEIKEVFDKYDMKASIAVITDLVGKYDSYITEEQLLDFYNDGWEVLSHSKTHEKSWAQISADQALTECKESKEYFDNLNIDVKGMAIPYIYIPEDYISIAEQYYEYCLGSTDAESSSDSVLFPRVHFTSVNDNGEEAAVEEMKQQIDNLIKTGGSCQYFFHYTRQIGKYLTEPDMNLNVLDQVLEYISQKQDQVVVELPYDIVQESWEAKN